MDCSTPGPPVHHQLPEFTETHLHWVGDAIQWFMSSSIVPFSSHLQSFATSRSFQMSQLFASGGQSIRVSNEHSGLISFRMDWLDFPAVQGTLKSFLQQFKSINSSVLSFLYSPTHPYMTTGKTIALMRRTFVGKVIKQLYSNKIN